MSVKTITVTPISGIPTTIEITSIKAVKRLQDVYHHQLDPNEKSRSVIILDADITGELTDERIKVDETVEEVKVMLASIKKTELE
jgi:hypothetical protein